MRKYKYVFIDGKKAKFYLIVLNLFLMSGNPKDKEIKSSIISNVDECR